MTNLVGQSLGSYQILAHIGAGGMADVYKALHTELNVERAIKIIRPEFADTPDFQSRFRIEAQAAASLEHPNIVRIHDFGYEQGRYYMVMQFLPGEDLKVLMQREGAMPSARAAQILLPVAHALGYAHQRGVIHRDFKPDNIMLTESGPVLTDFGIAKLMNSNAALTQTGMFLGTPNYMAPEQAESGAASPSSDIYALNVVLFEMLTGHLPFQAETPMALVLKVIRDPLPSPRAVNPAISKTLETLILRNASKDPAERCQSAEEYAEGLRRAVADDPTFAGAPPTASYANPSLQAQTSQPTVLATPAGAATEKKNRWPILVGVLVAVITGALYWTTRNDNGPPDSEVVIEPVTETQTNAAIAAPAEPTPGDTLEAEDELPPLASEPTCTYFEECEALALSAYRPDSRLNWVIEGCNLGSAEACTGLIDALRTDEPDGADIVAAACAQGVEPACRTPSDNNPVTETIEQTPAADVRQPADQQQERNADCERDAQGNCLREVAPESVPQAQPDRPPPNRRPPNRRPPRPGG